MPEILITVRGKIAQLANRSVVVCDNTDYVAVFDFDGEWDAYPTKTAQFNFGGIHVPVMFDGTACPMPQVSEASVLRIGVYAGDLHTTTSALVPCLPSIRSGKGAPADPPDNVYDQIMQKLNDMGVDNDYAQLSALISTDTLNAVHDTEGFILTDECGNIVLRA